ncbi:hypothetical protein [Oscillatoria sp. FACHB-1407]|nr:hypothetical protein [Oscillatoria sp. FACHB-1407]
MVNGQWLMVIGHWGVGDDSLTMPQCPFAHPRIYPSTPLLS